MTQAQTPTAFNLIIEGVGYLNRVRTITPKKGPAYTACTINALMGLADNVEHVSIDCIVAGKVASQVVAQLEADVKAERKVLVGFRASDPKPEFYEFPNRKTGELVQRSGLKARLLQVTFAKVDGQRVTIPEVPRNQDAQESQRRDDNEGARSHREDAAVPA